jgi:short-subunit dehydrogenase
MRKVVLITGATSGIGKEMAEVLASNGYKVYGTGRNINSRTASENLKYLFMDVRDQNSVNKAVKNIAENNGKVDILINSAGVGIAGALEEIPFNDIYNTYETNLFGIIRVTKEVIPYMRKNGSGLIVNISSIAGRVALPFQSIYSSSKFALECITEALSIELRDFGIKVCMIEPGDYKTNVNKNRKVIIPDENSFYSERLNGFFDLLRKNIDTGRNPENIRKLILRIVKSKNPKLRYKSGRLVENLTPATRFIAPPRIFEKILMTYYKI